MKRRPTFAGYASKLALYVLVLSLPFVAQAQGECTCTEYVYLNEVNSGGRVHKFEVNGDGSLDEVFSDGSTAPSGTMPPAGAGPWYPGTGSSQLPSPHGLGVDRNGYLYIGERFGGAANLADTRRLLCDGTILPETNFVITGQQQLFNITSLDGIIYSTGMNGTRIYAWDPCDGSPLGNIRLANGGGDDWGFHIDRNTGFFYSTSSGGYVWKYQPDLADFTAMTSYNPIITPNAGMFAVGQPFTSNNNLQGVTVDESGNIYVVEGNRDVANTNSRVLKYDADGLLVEIGPTDANGSDNTGWNQMVGIVYSSTSGRLYTSSLNQNEDCLLSWDPEDLSAAPVVHIGPIPGAGTAKGIAVSVECCPVNPVEEVSLVLCNSASSESINLNEIFPCGGTICEAQWALDPSSLPGGVVEDDVYESCDQTIKSGAPPGCYVFTRSSTQTGAKQCGDFSQTLNLEILPINEVTITADQSLNCGDAAAPLMATITGSDGGAVVRWESNTISPVAADDLWAPINVTTTTYDPGSPSVTTYYRVVLGQTSAGDGGDCPGGDCEVFSNVVTITLPAGCPPPPTTGSINSRLFIDNNNSGTIDGGDSPIGDVTVTLTPPAGVDLGNGPGQPVTTMTDANGAYLFENLPAGDYTVTIDTDDPDFPPGLSNTTDPDGGSDNTAVVTLAAGENSVALNFGYSSCPAVTVQAFAIQPSCDSDGNIAADGYVQISASDGLSYEVNEGGTIDGSGTRTTLSGASFPLRILTGLANPSGSQDYTVRVYQTDVGGDATCFTDITVTMQQQDCTVGCECEEFIYLNDLSGSASAIHKFSVDASGALTEIGSPWYSEAVAMEGVTNPHGVGVDLNGFVYVGESGAAGNHIRKFRCDGTILDSSEFEFLTAGQTNIVSINGKIVYNSRDDNALGDFVMVDPCTERDIASVNFCDQTFGGRTGGAGPGFDWGLHKDPRTDLFYATSSWDGGGATNGVFIFTEDDFDNDPSTCIDPIQLTPALPVPANGSSTGADVFRIAGITTDVDENMYIVTNDRFATTIYKYDSAGNLVATSQTDANQDGFAPDGVTPGGYANAIGIVYSETADRLYVSTLSRSEDCVALFDRDLNYLGSAVPAVPNASGNAKGIAIIQECCPTSSNQSIELVACNPEDSEPIFLNEVYPCEGGLVCEAQWEPADAMSEAVFDDCNLSILATVPGCYTFTRSSDGAGSNLQCGAFVQTFTIAIGEVTASVVSGDQEICDGTDPAPFTVNTSATGSDNLSFQWFVSTESDSTGFAPIAGATTEAYDPTPADLTADTVWFRNQVSITTCTGDMCTDTSNTVVVITVQDFVVDAGDDITVCRTSTVDLGGASITPDDFMATDGTVLGATWTSSGTGMFFNAAGDMLTGPVRLGEAISYQPSAADAASGSVTLTLTSDNPSDAPFTVAGCMPFVDEVTITILNVDCGTYPWGGND